MQSASVSCLILQKLSTSSHKRHNFQGKGFENKTRVFTYSKTFFLKYF